MAISSPVALREGGDPYAIASSLVRSGYRDVAVLGSNGLGPDGRYSYVLTCPSRVSDALDPLVPSERVASNDFPRWVGAIPYEALRGWNERKLGEDRRPEALLSRPIWKAFDVCVRLDHRSAVAEVCAPPDELGAILELLGQAHVAPRATLAIRVEPFADPDRAEHIQKIETIQALIREGEVYQISFARPIRLRVEPLSSATSIELGRRFHRAFGTAFEIAFQTQSGWIVGSSPELLLHAEVDRDGAFGRLSTEPIKGTRPRARNAALDQDVVRALEADPKERAELAMIVDLERNDLHRVCEPGTVVLCAAPHVVTYKTLHHRVCRLEGRVRDGIDREAVLRAMLPSGSVTGAPKVAAMERIAELEGARRGLYTGGFGYVAWDGSMKLAMAIRTSVFDAEGLGVYWTGGGIVADSIPSRELEETEWKAAQLGKL